MKAISGPRCSLHRGDRRLQLRSSNIEVRLEAHATTSLGTNHIACK